MKRVFTNTCLLSRDIEDNSAKKEGKAVGKKFERSGEEAEGYSVRFGGAAGWHSCKRSNREFTESKSWDRNWKGLATRE